MTLDEPTSWAAAAALERGEDPRPPLIPESVAAERIASAIGTHLHPAWLTDRALRDISMKLVAHRDFVRGVFDDLDADPKKIPDRDIVFQRQATAEIQSADYWLEQAWECKRNMEHFIAAARDCGAAPADFDPDARDIDAEDARAREVRQDQAAAEQAVRL